VIVIEIFLLLLNGETNQEAGGNQLLELCMYASITFVGNHLSSSCDLVLIGSIISLIDASNLTGLTSKSGFGVVLNWIKFSANESLMCYDKSMQSKAELAFSRSVDRNLNVLRLIL